MIKKTLISAVIWSLSLASLFGQDSSDIEVKLNIMKSFKEKVNVADIILVNKSDKSITVFTQNLSQSISADPKTGKAIFTIGLGNSKVNYEGHKLIPSKYSFLPVELNPGEAAKYNLKVKPFGNPFLKFRDFFKEVHVQYHVNDEFGKRFDAWSGTASSKSFAVINKEIQK